MKLLADVGVAPSTIRALRERGFEVTSLVEERLFRLDDEQILALAANEGQVVIAFDLDFGDLLAASGNSLPSLVTVRVRDQTPKTVTPLLLAALEECRAALEHGAAVTLEETRCRVRMLPLERGR